ncbi:MULTISPECIES: TetR family transcriptional regulator C-terminal domain-containing protein [Arthrobacter]|uniref:TetR family transcriptional regulator C-terminal domain-containing protein n=2 Tax=Arthrobacter TaxID=1663 RepID=A0ABU9KFP9_9MICC|nr:TetR family transcriptional regulator C-terminal domain-containing protein [Arthrobacter sp. YJM1]MDP5225716.1 TetR family transcriptional regulator C-terminal domain-containing protein [Arthrobacter sp. YJM1]
MGTVVRRRSNAITEEAIAERRVEILRATAEVIVASGLNGCSFGAVSDATGFSVGMIQHYFRTRDKLIDACVDHRMEESESEWRRTAAADGDAVRRLRALIDYAVMGEKDFSNAWGFWFELYAAARLDPRLAERVNERLSYWRRLFAEAIEQVFAAGLAAGTRPLDEVVNALLGLTDGLAFQTINGTFGMTVPRMHRLLYGFVDAELGLSLGEPDLASARYH